MAVPHYTSYYSNIRFRTRSTYLFAFFSIPLDPYNLYNIVTQNLLSSGIKTRRSCIETLKTKKPIDSMVEIQYVYTNHSTSNIGTRVSNDIEIVYCDYI